ncbi:MAG: RepB family DNA primase, partial [Chloroflexota bacterium]|nr:RepB family DNA primase [Chloroflexota bacterium]
MDEAASAYTFDRDQAAQQLDLMFGTDRGWLELACIDGPPDAEPKPDMQTKGWYVWPIQRELILDVAGELTVKYGNVYTCVSLFDRSYNRAKRYAKPGRVILVDDALVAGCTFATETSPDNYQSMLLLDRAEDAATREQIARRAAYANGGDHGGWDCTQMCRIGGTVNNKQKYGEPHQVRLVVGSGQTYSAKELLARWPATVLPATAGDTSLDWHTVALQRGNLERLVNTDGIPRRLKPGTFSYRVLTGDVTVPDRSVRRKMISKGVVGVGYPDDEAAAILQALCDYGHSAEKGTDWLNQDIARCIAKSREEWAAQGVTITVVPSHGGLTQPAAPLQDTLRKSRARKDRPQRLTTLDYYDDICQRADAEGRVNETRIQAAARLNISVPTVARFEHELTERGFLKRHTIRKRGATTSYLEVSRINIESAPQLGAASTAELVVSQAQPQNAEIAQQNAENHDAALPIEGTHPLAVSFQASACNMQLDVTSTPTGLRLADAMRAAIEAAAGEHGRVSKKRVQEQWAVFFAGIRWSDREYARVLKRRTQEAQVARLTAWAQDAKTQPVDLKRKARSLAYRQRQAVEEGHQAKAYALGL